MGSVGNRIGPWIEEGGKTRGGGGGGIKSLYLPLMCQVILTILMNNLLEHHLY